MLVTREEKFPHDIFEGMSVEEKRAWFTAIREKVSEDAIGKIERAEEGGMIKQTYEGGPRREYTLTASLVVLTERQAYTIALSQRFAPFNAEAQTLDELRENARRYAPDLLKMLVGE